MKFEFMKTITTRPSNYFQQNLATWQMERQEFANLPRLPAILTDVQTGWRLGFSRQMFLLIYPAV